MKKKLWKKLLAVGVLSGSIMFQTPACVQTAEVVTAASSLVTAGGVIYLVDRVIRN